MKKPILTGSLYCAIISLVCVFPSFVSGAPIAFIPATPIHLEGNLGAPGATFIDFNNDGFTDFQVENISTLEPGLFISDEFGTYQETNFNRLANSSIVDSFAFGSPEYNEGRLHDQVYAYGSIIGPQGFSSPFNPDIFVESITQFESCDFFSGCSTTYSSPSRSGIFPDSGVFPAPSGSERTYVGFGFDIDNALHFGWLDVEIISVGAEEWSNKDLLIHGWGYESTPNTSIAAGTGVIPIPPAIYLFSTGLLGLIGISRRRKTA